MAVNSLPVVTLIGGVASGILLVGGTRAVTAQDPARVSQEDRLTATALENAFMKIADTAGPAAVAITAQIEEPGRRSGAPRSDEGKAEDPFAELFPSPPRRGTSFGSGVVVRPDGHILTNDHVVANARGGKVKVTLADGAVYTGTVVRDPRSDLAVVKIQPAKPLSAIKFADSDKLHVGQWAVAIGSPFGQQNTMTTGIVSALHRKSEIGQGADRRYYPALIQTDAAINRGNSGGPLLDIGGNLIGINVAIYSPTGTSAGIGFAIPANTARFVMDQLIARGKVVRGSLGVRPVDISPELRQQLRVRQGAYIREVHPDTPADRAGIQPGDVVIRFNNKEIADELTLREAIGSAGPGSKVEIALVREGKPLQVSATLEELKETPIPEASAPVLRAPNPLGLDVRPVNDEVREQLKFGADVQGLVIVSVTPGSPAAEADLRPGMVITSVAGQSVATGEALQGALSRMKSGEVCLVRVLRPTPGGKPVRSVIPVPIP